MDNSKNKNKQNIFSQFKFNLKPTNNNKKQIIISMIIFIVLFAALISYTLITTILNGRSYINSTYNHRETVLLTENLRGTIYGANGEILATSIQNPDGTQYRIYPYGAIFAHAVGYSTIGKTGVEASANYYLLNTDNSPMQKADNKSNGVLNPCYSVYTTLNVDLQKIADEYLGSSNGAVIMTEVKTGKILTMVSHPNFDPNTIESNWNNIIEDEKSSILMNRTTQGLYPPGSTFKMVTALEYYCENEDKYNKYDYECNGYFQHDGYRINCYHGTVHGKVDFDTSFAKSCNASFANIGMSLNRRQFEKRLNTLLFNKALPGDFTLSESSITVNEDITDYEMMQTSIGQGTTLISPYHLNLITMSIANNGTLMTPYIVDRIENSKGRVVKTYYPEKYDSLITYDQAEFLQSIMEKVVLEGTASRLKNEKYSAAGKTGSAEFGLKGESHAWFTGYAPADDPQVAITIIVEKGGSGGERAVPLAKLMFDAYFN